MSRQIGNGAFGTGSRRNGSTCKAIPRLAASAYIDKFVDFRQLLFEP